jgi:murein DD-endopeptidase
MTLSLTSRLRIALLVAAMSTAAWAAPNSGLPLNLTIAHAPAPVQVHGATQLHYEMHINNFSAQNLELAGVDVLDAANPVAPLASYRGPTLEKLLRNPSAPADQPLALGRGTLAMVFLDLTVDAGRPVPAKLLHRLVLSLKRPDGTVAQRTMEGATVAVLNELPLVLKPPLRGSNWFAYDVLGTGGDDHRRTIMAVNGKAAIAQRFAIDWAKLGSDGKIYKGDGMQNPDWYDFGADVLAVADGTVVDVKDGIPENAPKAAPVVPIGLETIGGNFISVDIGGGRFAFFAHLQPGSQRVKVGDKVKAGQVLAKVGNTGNSDGPHLHFQVTNGNSILGSEGVPYSFESFTLHGTVGEPLKVAEEGAAWFPPADSKPVIRYRELPGNMAVVSFP